MTKDNPNTDRPKISKSVIFYQDEPMWTWLTAKSREEERSFSTHVRRCLRQLMEIEQAQAQ